VADAIETAVQARGSCAIGLSGGETPRPVYQELASHWTDRIPWGSVRVFFSDERAVPPDHPDSNYHMARETLLAHVPVPSGQVHRMEAERSDLAAAAADYERILSHPLDLLLLGMGADGHTASLFPGSPALAEQVRRVLPVRGPKPPAERLTITPLVIAAARRLATIATGESKARQVARVLHGPRAPEELPAQLAKRGTWFLDRAAAMLSY
jgi:6-phosphogluconolactonase